MKSPTEIRFYTAKEVVEILQKAKELKVVSIKLQGFEAAFSPLGISTPALAPLENKADETCSKCGNELTLGQYGKPYCRPCYLQRKEREYQRTRRW